MADITISCGTCVCIHLGCFILAAWSMSFFVRGFWTGLRKLYMLIYLAIAVEATAFMIPFRIPDDGRAKTVSRAYIIGVFLLLAAFLIARLFRLNKSFRRVSAESVKECVDRLPIGICCYYEGGQVKLLNKSIEELCVTNFGQPLMNGEWFEEQLGALKLPDEDADLLKTTDERFYELKKKDILIDGVMLKELITTDVTREYALTQELKEKNGQIARMNVKLKELSEESLKTAVEKEVLAAKIRVHDDLGRVILMARRYLNGDSGRDADLDYTAEELRRQAVIMLSESPDEWRRDYGYVFRTARQLGLMIRLNGRLPQEDRAKRLAVSVLNCAVLNSARHAGADLIDVVCNRQDDPETGRYEYRMSVSDNVTFQVEKVEEKGGLRSLRNELEAEGGSLIVRVGRGVSLEAVIPMDPAYG